eukprot:748129-Rhodomonas_salina.1
MNSTSVPGLAPQCSSARQQNRPGSLSGPRPDLCGRHPRRATSRGAARRAPRAAARRPRAGAASSLGCARR